MKKVIFVMFSCSGQWSRIAPPHSYISVDDFAGPKDLAERLHHLDRNPEEYLSYFWWTDAYAASHGQGKAYAAFCSLCAKLHDPAEEPRSVDLYEWWWEGSRCREEEHWYISGGVGSLLFEDYSSVHVPAAVSLIFCQIYLRFFE